MQSAGDNKRLAKNTVYLYIRTVVILLVSLYTSRIVLETLGVDDFGIYNVVAGIIALMGFFQTAQSKSTSRFITYELGAHGIGDPLRKVFSAALSIHIIAALIAILICETIGLYIVMNWISIPSDKYTAAIIVYQFAILVFCIHLVRVPYDSVVIAHEDMSIFAYFSIVEALLQLGLVFIVKYVNENVLILYSGLMCASAFILLLMYYLYVKHKYPIYKFNFLWDKKMSQQMLSFSGWTLLGAGANAGTQQGVNILMNNFVGLVANAAIGLAGQVNVAVSKFVAGFSTAFTPQIIKLYAQKNFTDLNLLISRSSKFSFALCFLFALPLLFNMDFVLHLWLGHNVPEYTAGFCCMILICTIFDATTGVYNTAITASGKIKTYQIWISISFITDLVLSAILLICKINPVLVFSSRILTRGLLNMIIGLYYVNKYTDFNIRTYTEKILSGIMLTVIICTLPMYFIMNISDGWSRLIITTLLGTILLGCCTSYILMNSTERVAFYGIIKRKLFKHG